MGHDTAFGTELLVVVKAIGVVVLAAIDAEMHGAVRLKQDDGVRARDGDDGVFGQCGCRRQRSEGECEEREKFLHSL